MEEKSRKRYIINSLDRALKILELLAREGEALGVTELGRRLDVDKSMVYRMLSTLVSRGYVEQDQETRKYRLGLKVVELAGMKLKSIQLFSTAKPYLKELVKQTGETVHLAVMVDGEVMYLDKEEGPAMLNIRSGIGLKCPPHASSVGKVLLAYLSDEQLIEVVRKHGLPRYTDKTIISFAELKEHLVKVREQGYALDDEESYVGVRCIAAPVRNHKGEVVASLGISGPTQRITNERIRLLADIVIETAEKVSTRLGYHAPLERLVQV